MCSNGVIRPMICRYDEQMKDKNVLQKEDLSDMVAEHAAKQKVGMGSWGNRIVFELLLILRIIIIIIICSLLCCWVSRPVYVGLLAQYICLLYSMHTLSTEEEESCNRQWGKGLEKTQRIQILDCITLDFITLLWTLLFCPHLFILMIHSQ